MFNDDEKRVFEYHDGRAPVRADPVALQRRLNQLLGGNVNEVIDKHANASGIVGMNATDRLAEATRIAFGMPWSGGAGPDENAVLAVVDGFHKWLEKKNQSTENSPTCSQPSAGASTD